MNRILLVGILVAPAVFLGCLSDEDITYAYQIGASGNPGGEPTWENSISTIMYQRCAECHEQYVSSYDSIMPWILSGELEEYTIAEHYIEGQDKSDTLYWLELGAPETDEDVEGQ